MQHSVVLLFVLSLSAVRLLGCGNFVSKAPPTAIVDIPFEIQLGNQTSLKAPGFLIKFNKVVEDSRCPQDVVCIWAGRAVIQLDLVRQNGVHETLTLTSEGLAEGDTDTIVRDGYRLRFVNLAPSPLSEKPTVPSTYRVTLLVVKS